MWAVLGHSVSRVEIDLKQTRLEQGHQIKSYDHSPREKQWIEEICRTEVSMSWGLNRIGEREQEVLPHEPWLGELSNLYDLERKGKG